MLPGAHAWVQGFAHDGSEDPCRASDEPLPTKAASRKWSSSAQNRGYSSSSIRRGNAVDGLISDPDSELHAAFKAALEKHKLKIIAWQQCVEMPPSAPEIFQGHAPVLDCVCTTTSSDKGGGGGVFVPVEVKACRPRRQLKRRSAKDAGCKPPFQDYADTWGLRHQLQLLMQSAALGHHHHRNGKPRGFVAYVDVCRKSVTLVKLNPALWPCVC
ncbi:MAG: hypothetical protein CMI26_14770 [Opitutae bacterium]|nr:hypothetical protein [Opitutae bacterium]